MADLLIHHLEKKGQEHSSLAMLVNQWGFDQLLIPKALQNVGSLIARYGCCNFRCTDLSHIS